MLCTFGVFLLIAFAAIPAYANGGCNLIGYTCDTKGDSLILSYKYDDECGYEMFEDKALHQWNPRALVEYEDINAHTYISKTRTVTGECKLTDGLYIIIIGPAPGNHNVESQCGGFLSAWAKVQRATEIILPSYQFEPGCFDPFGPITTEIIIKAGSNKPILKKVPVVEFYK